MTGTKSARGTPVPAKRLMKKEIQEIRQQFVETAGHVTQSFGVGRAIGQIYAHIYFSREPQSLDDLTGGLGISKGSASMVVRQLEAWGALRRVWIKGARKDYYEATADFGRIIRRAVLDSIGHKVESSEQMLGQAEDLLIKLKNGDGVQDPETRFFFDRVRKLQVFKDRAKWVWNKSVLRLLLK